MKPVLALMALAVSLLPHIVLAGEPLSAVWIDHHEDPAPATFRTLARRLEEIDVELVSRRVAGKVSAAVAKDILAAHRAAAVAWHLPDGTLAVALAAPGGADCFEVEAGTPDEEALYITELITTRVLGRSLSSELLVTAPIEVVPPLDPPQLSLTRPRPTAARPAPEVEAPARGPRLGLGWRAWLHRDEVTWARHGIAVLLPAWLFESGLELMAVGVVGLPARIGRVGVTWLELTTIEVGVGAGYRLFRGRRLDAEVSAGVGAVQIRATAFLEDGTTDAAQHLSGQTQLGAGVVWRPAGRIELRLHGGVNRCWRPGWFSINQRGDFGAAPWQPFIGLDLSRSLPRT